MRGIRTIADKLLARLVPSAPADAAICWWEPCTADPNGCIRRCCTHTGCAGLCACLA